MNERQIAALKQFDAAGKAGLAHRTAETPDNPHHKTCNVLVTEGLLEYTNKPGVYKITKLGKAKLSELRA